VWLKGGKRSNTKQKKCNLVVHDLLLPLMKIRYLVGGKYSPHRKDWGKKVSHRRVWAEGERGIQRKYPKFGGIVSSLAQQLLFKRGVRNNCEGGET